MSDQDYALIFAVDRYGDTDKWRPLEGAVNDANRFRNWLINDAGLPALNIIENKGNTGDRPQLSDLMSSVMNLLGRKEAGSRIGRRLYIFLAGHGVEAIDQARLEPLMVTAESQENWVQGFPGQIAMSHFRIEARFEEVLLFMDCCRTMSADARPNWNIPTKPDQQATKVRWGSALAAQLFTEVRERPVDGKMQGIFSNALMDGLEGKARDGKGRITTESLQSHLKNTLIGDEHPDIHFPFSITLIDTDGETEGNRALLNLPDLPSGMKLVFRDGSSNFAVVPVEPKQKPEGGLTVELPAFGTYLMELVDANGTVKKQKPVVIEGGAVSETY